MSCLSTTSTRLSSDLLLISLDVTGKDLTRIKTGLVIGIPGSGKAQAIYLDDCKYE